ncbi:MAG: guanylate kinase [Candidatus Geothermincolales bacterium]
MGKGRLFVVSGPSGVGKGTVISALLSKYPKAWLSISATTRKPRPGERHGVDYFFIEEDDFLDKARKGDFLEWAEVHGNLYGTPVGEVERKLAEGRDVFLEIDVKGALQVMKKVPDAITIFLAPPSMEELEKRLLKRGTESEEEIDIRLRNAEKEARFAQSFRYLIINDDLERAVEELCAIYEKERGGNNGQDKDVGG